MARYYVQQNAQWPYHITARCPNREHFPLALPAVWEIMEDYLYLARLKHGFRIHSFILMPNHFHLVASLSDVPIGRIMCEFLSATSKAMNFESGRINQRWGGRHYKCVLDSNRYYLNTYKYVYQNPVRAGLSERAEEWPFSTLHGLLGKGHLSIPLEPDPILIPDSDHQLDLKALEWINTRIDPEHLADMQAALKKKRFRLPKKSKHPNPIEHILI